MHVAQQLELWTTHGWVSFTKCMAIDNETIYV